MRLFCLSIVCTLALSAHAVAAGPTTRSIHADLVVAADASGDCTTVQAALDRVPRNGTRPFTIFIASGSYHEKLLLEADRPNVHLVGESRDSTILTFDDYARKLAADGKELGTFRTPSFRIKASGFTAENLTFQNSAGPGKQVGQAVAVAVEGDRCTFANCRFLGHQDTLLDNAGRHYYRDCLIVGDVDFIFGNATSVFDHCEIRSIGSGYLTAQSRTTPAQTTGYVFSHCRLTADPGVTHVFLGRPWRAYSRVVYLDCEVGEHILPPGWDNWRDPAKEKTAYYGEYRSAGPGGHSEKRAAWSHQLGVADVAAFVPEVFLRGSDNWQPTESGK
jgi:pectinesterase